MLLVTFFRSVVKRPNQRNQRGSPSWSASAQQTRFISPPVDFFIGNVSFSLLSLLPPPSFPTVLFSLLPLTTPILSSFA